MKRIDPKTVPVTTGTTYPEPFAGPCRARQNQRLAVAAGLTQFGVNLTQLPPGAWSSQRHFHTKEDEFVYVVEGELVLVTDAGEETLVAGDFAGFPGGARDGHHLQNRSAKDAAFLVVGARDDDDWAEYPDIDLKTLPGRYSGRGGYAHKDGSKY